METKKGQEEEEEEAKIPVFTVLKNGAVLKNIFVISTKRTSTTSPPHLAGGGEEVLTVGRHPECDVVLMHPSVSRFHLQLNTDPSSRKLFVTDLSSVHGTWVSERKIEPLIRVEVREGDSIRVGGSTRVYKLHWVPLSRAYGGENLESDVAMDGNDKEEVDHMNGGEDGAQGNSLLDTVMQHHLYEEEDENQNKNLLAPGIEHFVKRSTIETVGQEQEKEENQVMQDKNSSDTTGCREVQCFDSVLESITSLFSDEISAFGLKNEFLTEILMPISRVNASSLHEEDMEILPENSLCFRQDSTLDDEREVELEVSCPALCCNGDQSVSQAVPEGDVVLCPMAGLERKSEAAVTADAFPSIDEVGFSLATDSTEVTENKIFVTKDDGWTVNSIREKDPTNLHNVEDTSSDDVNKGNIITECSLPVGQAEKEEYFAEIGRSNRLPSASSADYPAVSNEPEQVANQFPSEESTKKLLEGSLGVALLASEVLNSSFSRSDEDTGSDDVNKGSRVTKSSIPIGPVHETEKEVCTAEIGISNLLRSASSADYIVVCNAPEQVANHFLSEKSAEQLADRSLGVALLASEVLNSSFSRSDEDTGSDDVNKGSRVTKSSIPIGPVHETEKEECTAEIGISNLLRSASSADYIVVCNAPEQVANHFLSEKSAEQLADRSLGITLLASEVLNSSFSSSYDVNKGSRITECSLPVGPVCDEEKEECFAEIERSNRLPSASSADYLTVGNALEQVANQFPLEESSEQFAEGSLGIALLATEVNNSSFSSSDEDSGSDDVNKGSRVTKSSLPIGPVRETKKEECMAEIEISNLLRSASSADYIVVCNAPEQVANHFPSEKSAEQLAYGSLGITLLASAVLNSSFSSTDEDIGSDDVDKGGRITECALPLGPVCEEEKEVCYAEIEKSNLQPSASSADYLAVSNAPEQVANQFSSEESSKQFAEVSLGIASLATEVHNSSFSVRQPVSDITIVKENQDPNFYLDHGMLKHSESPHVRSEKKIGSCSISSKRIKHVASARASTLSAGRMVKGAESDCEANSDSQWEADKEDFVSDKELNWSPKTPRVPTIRKHGKAEAVGDVTPPKSSSSKLGLSPYQDVIASSDQTPGAVHKRKSEGMTLMNQVEEKMSGRDVTPCKSSSSKVGLSHYQDVIASCDKENQTPSTVHKRKSKGKTLMNQVGQKMSREKRSGRVPLQPLNVNGEGNGKPDVSFSMDTTSISSSVDCSQSVVANLVGKSLSESSFAIPGKLDLDGVGRRWTMVADTTTLLDKESRKSLQLLQGLKSTRLIIPRTVLGELACLEKQSSIFSRQRTDASIALDWITKCTAESPWWIHLQKAEMEWSSTARTSPSSLKFSTMTTSLQTLVGWMTSEIIPPPADDDLIDCALCYKRICSDEQFVLLSNNVNLTTKAVAEGLVCETAPQFRNSLVNPFSERFLWGPSSPRGRTWSVVDDVMLKEHFYRSASVNSERREWTKGLKIILLPSCTSGKSFSI